MITEVCIATYELNPAFDKAYALEQADRVVAIILNPEASDGFKQRHNFSPNRAWRQFDRG